MKTGLKLYYKCIKTYIKDGTAIFCKGKIYVGNGNHFTDDYDKTIYMSDNYITKYFTPLVDNSLEDNKKDNVNHPGHYNTNNPIIVIKCDCGNLVRIPIECIDVIRNMPTWKGNAIKYLWRAGLKEDASLSSKDKEIEDLNKAIWYIKDKIKELEKNDKKRI